MEWEAHMEFITFGLKEASTGTVEELGGKGAGLLWLANEGVPVPPGFVIPTSVWAEYDKKPKTTLKAIAKALPAYLEKLEAHFGYLPLLSVRSGARVSCPGMMDTILNVGIEPSNVGEWTNRLGPACFADSFKRLVVMYGSVVHGIRKESLEGTLAEALDVYQEKTGEPFPEAAAQLLGAIEAVFKSWDNDRADFYRLEHGYDRAWGTAVTVQAMVFGNLNEQSGSGVLFTRNPNTGASFVTGEWLPKAQGEDIVAGIRTPQSLDTMQAWNPAVHQQLVAQVISLENLKREMLDIEFTIQDGSLYLLQVRTGKRTPIAAVKIATDFVAQGVIDAKEAVKRVPAKLLDLAQTVSLDPSWVKPALFTGIAACSGVVSGKPVFSKEAAIECKEPCILVTEETTPEDITGMKAAVGIITMHGGMTCHAAVVARPMNRPCIVGVGASLESFKGAAILSMDGATGRIWAEEIPVTKAESNGTIHAFQAMVCKALGVVPVLFDAPSHKLPEAVLYLGDQILNPLKAAQTVLLALHKVDRLYLDLVPGEGDAKFLKIFATHDHTARVLALLETALASHEHYGKLVVVVPNLYVTGLQRLTTGTDLRSLILADEVALDASDVTDPAIQRVLAWKQAEGLTVVSLGAYVPAAKSAVSHAQAFQLLGK